MASLWEKMMGVEYIRDHLWSVAKARAEKSPDGVGVTKTKNQKVCYRIDPYGLGIDSIESVRFIEMAHLKGWEEKVDE
jgi:hypothetical protein